MPAPSASVVLLLLGALAGAARGAVIDARDAAAHVGSAVTVEGDVVAARLEPIGMVLELAPGGPTSVRIVLIEALLSGLPRAPERIYEGKRVRVTALLQRFRGRPEMVIESRSQIEVVDVAGAPAVATTTTTATAPAPTAPPATMPPPVPAAPTPAPTPTTTLAAPPPPAAAPAPIATPPATVPAPVATPPAPAPAPVVPPPAAAPATLPEPAPRPLLTERLAAERCQRARAAWRDAAARLREAADDLTRCLDGESFACHAPAAGMAPAIADLEWAEQQVRQRCE